MLNRRGALGLLSAAFFTAPRQGGAASSKPLLQQDLAGDARLEIWRNELGPTDEGPARPVDIGYISVPADHFSRASNRQSKGVYRLRFARFPSRQPNPAPPLFFFDGGPFNGEDFWFLLDQRDPTYAGPSAFEFIDAITAHADLVLIDHRGSFGCLNPKILSVNVNLALPLDHPLTLEQREAALRGVWTDMIAHQAQLGVDLTLISTPQLACDVDQIRAALGYDKIRLCGDSNGTYRCREYLRRFQNKVDSALLFISHGYQKCPAPHHVKPALDRIEQAVAADPIVGRHIPSLTALLDDLTAKFDKSPVTVPVKAGPAGDTTRIVLSGADIAIYCWNLLGAENKNIRRAPGRLWSVAKGDFSHLARTVLAGRGVGINQLNAAERAYSASAMPSASELARYRRAAGGALYLNRECVDALDCASPLPRDDRHAFAHSAPITYVLGDWDMRTPIEAVNEVGGNHVTTIINPHMGHDLSLYRALPFWEKPIFDAFLEGRTPAPYTGFSGQFDPAAFG